MFRTLKERRAADVFEGLVDRYRYSKLVTNAPYRVEQAVRTGAPIPEKLLPGRAVMALSSEDRAALAHLTCDMVQHRFP